MTPNSSIIELFTSGHPLPEQWLGLFVLVALGVLGFVLLIRQHATGRGGK